MTAATRKELLGVLEELCRRYPHWRFGQLVSNLCGWADAQAWDAEDEQLLEVARKHLESPSQSPVEIRDSSGKVPGHASPPSSTEAANAYPRIADERAKNVLTADQALQDLLGGIVVPTEIRDPSGKVLGHYIPEVSPEDQEAYARVAELFDMEEVERIAATEHGQGIPLAEFWRQLESGKFSG